MALTDGEKLTIAMLADMAKALKVRGDIDYNFISDHAVGSLWAVKAKYPGIFGSDEDDDPKEVRWTHDVLTMWLRLESGYENLDDSEKDRVKASPGSHGHAPKFAGFDGHSNYSHIARTMIERLGYYEELVGRPLDSHMPDIDTHGRMLTKYKELQGRRGGVWGELSADQIIEIVNETIHPSNR